MNCDNIHVKPIKARTVVMLVVVPPQKEEDHRTPTASMNAARQAAIDSGKYVEARDGNWVGLGQALCGSHEKSVKADRRVSAEMVDDLGGKAAPLALDFAKRLYEKRLDEEAERRAQQEADWNAHQKELAVEPIIVGESDPKRHEFTVLLVNANSGRPVGEVYVSVDGGVAKVGLSNYSGHVGRGAGNLSYLRAVRDALGKAEAFMVENYKANGLEV